MSTKKTYEKEALTIKEQVKLLEKRGLIIRNKQEAEHYLNNISYYHLSGYFKPYQNSDDTFIQDTDFNKILQLYFFDRKLRLLFTNALERIEKSFKTQFAYHLSTKYGPHCLTNNSKFEKHLHKINKNLKTTKEPCIEEFKKKYSNEHPPLWMLIEILSFGDILNIFSRSLDNKDKKEIAKHYGHGWIYMYSWMENLREIRNICAHYSRLWNRKITKHLKHGSDYNNLRYDSHIFDSIIITSIILKKVSPKFNWLEEIKSLVNDYEINFEKMGFPNNWEEIFNEINEKEYEDDLEKLSLQTLFKIQIRIRNIDLYFKQLQKLKKVMPENEYGVTYNVYFIAIAVLYRSIFKALDKRIKININNFISSDEKNLMNNHLSLMTITDKDLAHLDKNSKSHKILDINRLKKSGNTTAVTSQVSEDDLSKTIHFLNEILLPSIEEAFHKVGNK